MSNHDRDSTDPESSIFPADRGMGGVISGEAVPPDEHTRRVAAMKKKQGEEAPEPTILNVHDQPTRTAVPAESDRSQEQLLRQARAVRTGPGDPTDVHVPAATMRREVYQDEDEPPGPVRAYTGGKPAKPAPAPARDPASARDPAPARDPRDPASARETREGATSAREPREPTSARVVAAASSAANASSEGAAQTAPQPDRPSGSAIQAALIANAVVPPGAIPGAPLTEVRSKDLAERSLRERRRARDRRAERAAMRAVIVVFVGLGGLAYWFVNSDFMNDPEEAVTTNPNGNDATKAAVLAASKKAQQKNVTSAPLDETPDLPALRMLGNDGLTIAAGGIAQVVAPEGGAQVGVIAAVETCRFTYGVWEFSPNKVFRFLTTCEALEGQVLVGAYEVHGSRIKMSPLVDGPATIVSEFEVEKPSHMTTEVLIARGNNPLVLRVNQAVTNLRGGMNGEAFHDTYAPRNTLKIPGQRAPAEKQGGEKRDPLLEMLKDRQQ